MKESKTLSVNGHTAEVLSEDKFAFLKTLPFELHDLPNPGARITPKWLADAKARAELIGAVEIIVENRRYVRYMPRSVMKYTRGHVTTRTVYKCNELGLWHKTFTTENDLG